jgi:hypothetical protein
VPCDKTREKTREALAAIAASLAIDEHGGSCVEPCVEPRAYSPGGKMNSPRFLVVDNLPVRA